MLIGWWVSADMNVQRWLANSMYFYLHVAMVTVEEFFMFYFRINLQIVKTYQHLAPPRRKVGKTGDAATCLQ